jgi:hypothetical protein
MLWGGGRPDIEQQWREEKHKADQARGQKRALIRRLGGSRWQRLMAMLREKKS